MTQYDNRNQGALFINKRRESDKHPNLNGTINIEGVEYWISGWTNTVQNGQRAGEKMIKLAVNPKEPQQAPPRQGDQSMDDMDDNSDIPF